jgi:hypothetical protein
MIELNRIKNFKAFTGYLRSAAKAANSDSSRSVRGTFPGQPPPAFWRFLTNLKASAAALRDALSIRSPLDTPQIFRKFHKNRQSA